jgi:DNA-binding NarL/FixJ family response regulator
VRVALADDGALFREGISRLLGEAGFEVCARCATADELLREVDERAPDVAIVDIRMPPTYTDEGVRAAHAIRARHPAVGVLVLSQYAEFGLAMQLLSDSAHGLGYLVKDRVGDVREFAEAVRRVAAGGSALDPIVVSQLLERGGADPLEAITPREREVLALMAEGRSNPPASRCRRASAATTRASSVRTRPSPASTRARSRTSMASTGSLARTGRSRISPTAPWSTTATRRSTT